MRGKILFNQIKHQWRITKYDPKFRDENGYYTLKDEWTCPSEIGKVFEGRTFTLDDYLQVEAAYVNAVAHFMEESGLDTLRILLLSQWEISKEDMASILYENEFDQLNLRVDLMVDKNEIHLICKMVLRNFIDCQLYFNDQFFVNFGWDYYMYIGSTVNCLSAIENTTNDGLFVENVKSPFLSEQTIIRRIEWCGVNDDIIVGEEELKNIPLDEYRKMFNLTVEHPLIGSFKIEKEQQEFFQTFLIHKMDFNKFEYFFYGGD